jgi:hypothetical protein
MQRNVEPLASEDFAQRMLRPPNSHEMFLIRTKQWPELAAYAGADARIVPLGPIGSACGPTQFPPRRPGAGKN